MKVAAKHRLNYSGAWYEAGDEFEIESGDISSMREYVRKIDYVSAVFPPEPDEEKPRRGRRKKVEN